VRVECEFGVEGGAAAVLDRSASYTYNVNMRGLLAKKERFSILIRSFSTPLSHAPSWGAAGRGSLQTSLKTSLLSSPFPSL
jgi:hypothetical protein